jgi:DedD protein
MTMAEHSTPSENEENTGEIRGQLVKRLAVAGALVAVLLGVLAVFDRLATTDEVEIPVFTKPVPVAPRKEVTQPVTAATNLPEPPAPAVQEPPPAPVVEEPVVAKVETKTEVQETAKPEIRGSGRSTVSNAKPVVTATPESSPRQYNLPAATPKANVPSLAEGSAEPVVAQVTQVVTEAKPAVTPSARISDVRRGSSAVETNSVQRLFSGFLLQAGVFTSPQRAEELHAKLTLSGVPSTLETRVQVGPFKTRQEAEAAQEKLKQLGVETLLVPPKGARN